MSFKKENGMPEISRFYGIIITMYHNDHDPPHVHVRYNRERGRFSIAALDFLDGDVRPRVRRLVIEWATQRQAELQRDWELALAQQPLLAIEPLE